MSNTHIQIKRSTTNATVTGLLAGEFAYTQNTNLLYIGNPNGTNQSVVGGLYNFGTLSACSALVTNASSSINQLICANLTTTYIYANSSYGNTGQILTSNSSGGAYWNNAVGGGTVTSITMGNGLTSTQSPLTTSGTMSVNIGPGLMFTSGALTVNTGSGIALSTNALVANLAATPGLQFSSGGLAVLGGPGLIINATGVCVNLAASPGLITTSGLAISPGATIAVGATTTVNLAATSGLTGASGLAVVAGPGLIVNSTGTCVNLATTSGLSTTTGLAIATSSQFTVNSGGLYVNATGALSAQDLTLAGNLTVSGTLTTLNTTTLIIKDNFIQLADGEATTTTFTDNVDSGLFLATGNTSANVYSGIARIAGSSTNTTPYFKIFATSTAVNTSTINATATVGTLQAYLMPWGAGGAFVVNAGAMAFTANSTVSLALVANTMSLTTALPIGSGGTGLGVTTNCALLMGSGTTAWTALAAGTDTNAILQANNGAVAWSSTLDCGVF